MTIRRRLNVAMSAMLAMLLVTAAVVVHSVNTTAQRALTQAGMRETSVFTDNVRAELFYRTAVAHGFTTFSENDWWPKGVLDDVEVRISFSSSDRERDSWIRVRDAIKNIAANQAGAQGNDPRTASLIREADLHLRKLRRHYDERAASAMADTAVTSSTAQTVVVACAVGSALLFAIFTLLIRDWLVKPIETLNRAADVIGEGNLDHRVPLETDDELGHLARRIDAMSERLSEHQRKLLEARELAAIGELCANVAHGLRNPLAGMRAGAQLALRRIDQPDKLEQTLKDIVIEVDRMDRRITQLFEFSHIIDLRPETASFGDLIDDARADARGVTATCGVEVVASDRTSGRAWSIDRQRISAAIGELITNAAHHSKSGDTITVTGDVVPSQSNGDSAKLAITVEDCGKGIPESSLKHLFDLFYTTRPSGTGMGLPLVRRIIEQHCGTIDLDSAPGRGTRARIVLAGVG
jgi:two-component system, NtrC family, sensor kinase